MPCRRGHDCRLPSFLLLGLVAAASAHAQDKTASIDRIFSWVKPGSPGCVAAASHNGALVVNRAYGLADLERNVPLTVDSVFDAASIRKQFVAAAILLLVEEKRLALTDDVRTYIPELPDYGRTITLDHMLSHTSGLRDWTGLRNFNSGSEPAMPMILRQRALDFAPGEEWAYSNSGYVLLTEIVARRSGMPFSEFARTRLFEPLGMTSTTYVDDLRQVVKNRALAFEPQGAGWRMDMLIDNERGGGGALFSTASDLVLWSDGLTSGRLGRFVTDKLDEPAKLNNGRVLDYGRGLIAGTNYAGRLFHHGGGAAGFRSVLVRFPDSRISVAVLCNAGEASDDRDGFAARIFDLFAAPGGVRPPAAPTPATTGGAPIEGLDLSGKAGVFVNDQTGRLLRLAAANGRLVVAGGGPLVAVTKDRFRIARPTMEFMSKDAFEITFLSGDQFEYTSMEGRTTRYRRARPWAPTAGELTAYAGRYESDELRARFQIVPGKTGLAIRLNDAPGEAPEFPGVVRDTFQHGNLVLRFQRNSAGAITGVQFTTPVFQNVPFALTR